MVSHPHPVGFNMEACWACGGNRLSYTESVWEKHCSLAVPKSARKEGLVVLWFFCLWSLYVWQGVLQWVVVQVAVGCCSGMGCVGVGVADQIYLIGVYLHKLF